jgi:hypothetical protein
MSRQEFYAALFPAWKFAEKVDGTAEMPVVQFTFEQPSGKSSIYRACIDSSGC